MQHSKLLGWPKGLFGFFCKKSRLNFWPTQYENRASLTAQLVKNLPAMQETPVWSSGEGTGYPLQCSRAFLVAQLVKNPPAMWETWVQFLGWEDPLEKGKATHSSILAWRIPRTI